MEAPRRYSVTPWYSFVTVTPTQHVPSLKESLRLIWRWWRGFRPTLRERQIEAAQIERLAAEMEAELPTSGGHKGETNLTSETRSGETRSQVDNWQLSKISSHRRDESHGRPG
jgi:hypothetical protein